MTRSHLPLALAAALTLGIAAPAAAGDDPPLKITAADAARGQTSVVIGAFNVGFIFQSVDNGKANGGLIGAFGGATRAKSELVGVTPEMMQAITDAAYNDFRAQLAAKGYTVADPAALFTAPEMIKVKADASPAEYKVALEKDSKGKGTYYKPSALPRQYFLPGDVTTSAGGMLGGFAKMGMIMDGVNSQVGMMTFSRTNGQAIIDVTYLIDFSQVKRPGAFSFGGIKVNSGMAVVDEYSRLSLMNPKGKMATLLIKQPVAVEGDFATMEDATKDKALQTASNVAGGVLAAFGAGGMKFGKSRTYRFTVKPDAYSAGAVKAATLANTRLVDQLAALR